MKALSPKKLHLNTPYTRLTYCKYYSWTVFLIQKWKRKTQDCWHTKYGENTLNEWNHGYYKGLRGFPFLFLSTNLHQLAQSAKKLADKSWRVPTVRDIPQKVGLQMLADGRPSAWCVRALQFACGRLEEKTAESSKIYVRGNIWTHPCALGWCFHGQWFGFLSCEKSTMCCQRGRDGNTMYQSWQGFTAPGQGLRY